MRYRLGRSHQDIVYRQLGDEPSDEDPRVAVFTEAIDAIAVVALLNGDARAPADEPLLVRCRSNPEPHVVDDHCRDIYEAPAVAPADEPVSVPPPVDAYLTEDLTDEALAEVRHWHAIVHPDGPDGVYEPARNPSGCDRFFCLTIVTECAAVAAPRWWASGVAEGRRQAAEERTEGGRA